MLNLRTVAQEARDRLTQARKELARRHPALVVHVMMPVLLEPTHVLKYQSMYPGIVFASDSLNATYNPNWVMERSLEELVFVWGQLAIKVREGWVYDLSLTNRNQQWVNIAQDVIANAQLVRDGVGAKPQNAAHFDGITADTDTEDAYDIVRAEYQRYASDEDELGKVHVNTIKLLKEELQLKKQLPQPREVYGMFEAAVCCELVV